MVLIGFKKEFAELVRTGQKTQTIRTMRKYSVKVGERLYLYTEPRTKKCEKLGEGICTEVRKIWINELTISVKNPYFEPTQYRKNSPNNIDDFARSDGFKSWEEMRDWFNKAHGLPFEGVLIKWEFGKDEDKQ